MTDVGGEPLEHLRLEVALLRAWGDPLKFFEHSRGESRVDDVVGVLADDRRALLDTVLGVRVPAAQAEDLVVVLVGEGLLPRHQLLRDVLVEVLLQALAGAAILVAGDLVDEGDDADTGEARHEDLACFGDVGLIRPERSFAACFEHGLAQVREDGGLVAIDHGAALRSDEPNRM